MRIHLILDVTPETDEGKKVSFANLMEEFEAELEHHPLEVDGKVFNVKVMGVGKNAREVDESFKARAQYRS